MAQLEELNFDLVNKDKGLKATSTTQAYQGFNFVEQDPLLIEDEGPFLDLPENTGAALRNRSMTFHYPANSL